MPNNPLSRVNLRNPVHFLALGFGSGLMRSGNISRHITCHFIAFLVVFNFSVNFDRTLLRLRLLFVPENCR